MAFTRAVITDLEIKPDQSYAEVLSYTVSDSSVECSALIRAVVQGSRRLNHSDQSLAEVLSFETRGGSFDAHPRSRQ